MDTQNPSIDADLAKANLLRLRGDYAAAHKLCMAILDRATQDPTVAALLGDIAAEQGNYESAAQWYEVAVDGGAGVGIADKLTAIQLRIKERDARNTEKAVGLPPRTHVPLSLLLGTSVVVILLLVAAYVLGAAKHQAPVASGQQGPIVLPRIDSPTPTKANESKVGPPPVPPSSAPVPVIDPDLATAFANADGVLSKVTGAELDPRSHTVTITAPADPGEDTRTLAASLAGAVFERVKDAQSVTIRVTRLLKPVLVADATREKFESLTNGQSGASAQVDTSILSNVWESQ